MLKRMRTYLGVIFAIFRRDVRRVVRNPVALVIALGMIVMPSAYAWYVVAANWDPYGNTESMLVAVANEDAGADSPETGHLDVGAQVVAELYDNHKMGWEFTDAEAAVNGVYSGKYWAALVIPEGFSADFASVFTGDFTQPTIQYYVNEKASSIAPKVTDAAASAVEKAINENFVKTVTEKVVDTTQDAGTYAEDKADDAENSLTAGLRSAHKTVSETRETLDGLAGTVDSTREAAQTADDTLAGLQDDLPHLLDALNESKELLVRARATTNDYGTELSKNASNGALKLAGAAATTQQALGRAEGGVAAAEAASTGALAQAEALLADNEALVADLKNEATSAANPALAQAASQALARAQEANERLSATVESLKTAQADLTSTATALAEAAKTLNDAAQAGATTVQQTVATFQSSILPDITGALDSLVEACGTLEGAVQGLAPSLSQARAILAEMTSTLQTSQAALSDTSASLATMEDNLARSLTDLTALQNSATVADLANYLKADPAEVGAFMAAPVQLETRPVYAVANYGSGVTPFFTNLALWVAGFILMAMVKLRVDPEGLPRFTATQAYFGRWLFYVVVGLLMGLVCCVGDLVLGIQCESPAAFIGAGLLTVFVDVNLMYGLAYASRHIGKAVAVILLIMQIPGSSGMFPIEMMPPFFQAIHPLLPFTYSIDAMREAIGGFYGLDYLYDMLWLGLLFVPLGFAIGLGLGRADFNLTLMFDEKLGATDLLLAEPVTGAARENGQTSPLRYRTRVLMRALLDVKGFREKLSKRAAWFHRNYPRLVRLGWVLLVAQPLATFAVMVLVHADVNTRVMMLVAMVAGIIAVDTYLVVISYLHTRLAGELTLASMSADALQQTAARQGLGKAPTHEGSSSAPRILEDDGR